MEKVKDRRYLIAIALAIAVVALLVLWRPAAVEAVYPLDRARVLLTRQLFSSVAAMFRSASVEGENRRLRREIGSLSLERRNLERLESENARLRQALAFRDRLQDVWIPSEVLSSNCGAAGVHRLIRLSKGSLDGVVKGAVAVVPAGLVGRVASVTPHTCVVMTVSDPALRVACEIETGVGSRLPRGILSGGDEEHLELRYLTRATGLTASRQRVVTSGLGGVFPRGICVGCLVGRDGRTGAVQLAADLADLEFVFIRREN